MPRRAFDYRAETSAAPERVLAALTDFSDRRPDLFPGLSRRQYKVLERGDTWALAREGTANVWAVERWDWSQPGTVRSVLQEANFVRPGTVWEFRVEARQGGGSVVHSHLERDYAGLRGLSTMGLILALGGSRILSRYLRRTLDILERQEQSAGA